MMMRNILYILMAVALLTGCKTKYIPVPEYHEIVVHHADTLLRVDSVQLRDSVIIRVQGDTIVQEVWRWRDRVKYDTRIVYRDSLRVDSVRVPYPVERKQTAWERTMQNVGKISLIILVTSICFMLVYLLLRARKKIL
jgi:hypothetical protein